MTVVNEEQLFSLDSNLSFEEKFKNVEKFTPKCVQCQTEKSLDKIIDLETSKSVFECECGKVLNLKYLKNKLTLTIQKLIQKYLDQSVVCDDLGCRERTRNVGVYGRKCLKAHCKGVVDLEVSDKDLYNQLRYYEYLFDPSRVETLYPGKEVVLGAFEAYYQGLGEVVKRYLDCSSRHWVKLDKVFEFC
jgi:DNA polymerase alpha subunit A